MSPSMQFTPATVPSAQLAFTKLEGLGNDFVLIDHFFAPPPGSSLGPLLGPPLGPAPDPVTALASQLVQVTPELARRLLDRRFGVGGDQLLWLKRPVAGTLQSLTVPIDARMEILNPDGSTAEMCGNGIRAFALYFHRRMKAPKSAYLFDTMAGPKAVEMIGDGGRSRVNMGKPWLGPAVFRGGEPLSLLGVEVPFFEVNMGNPHAVFFVDDLDKPVPELPGLGIEALGPAVERHPRFANRTNVEFVKVDPGGRSVKVRVWERGTGVTLACGSGACAAAVAAIASGRVASSRDGSHFSSVLSSVASSVTSPVPVTVGLPGGELTITWQGPHQDLAGSAHHSVHDSVHDSVRGSSPNADVFSDVFMEGPAREVFSGEFNL
jgi:diaminopimelate epimerase